MPTYVIEREVPGAGALPAEQIRGLAAKSNEAVNQLGGDVQWVHSYVTADRLFCVYRATNETVIREHARMSGFPCDRVSRVEVVVDPVTGEGA